MRISRLALPAASVGKFPERRSGCRLSLEVAFAVFFSLFHYSVQLQATEITKMASIGPVSSYARSVNAVTIRCADNSQVQITILSPDLIRVRAVFGKPIPAQDHSWAIARTKWESTDWRVSEDPNQILITTSKVEIAIHRSPLLIEFRNAATHQPVNSDELPMMFDPHGEGIAAAKKLGVDEYFYGLGEKAAPLNKRRQKFTMWNTDNAFYVEGTDPIYQSIPFYIGLQNGAAYGIFFDNSYRTTFDFGQESQSYAAFSADGGEMNYYFIQGPAIQSVLERYSELTGHMPMPPIWALGNQQSRYSYYPDTVAEAVVQRYREHDLPLDVLFLDIDYMNEYRVFTWDPRRFPNPLGLTTELKKDGVKVVTSMDPGVAYQPLAKEAPESPTPELGSQVGSYYVFNQGLQRNYFLKRKCGELYLGKVWPEKVVFPDFTMDAVRRWWGDLHRAQLDNGVSGIWNDMNEPSDFSDGDGKNKMDVVSYDEGQLTTQAKNRNVYGLLMSRATYEGMLRLRPNQRPFVITRSGYAGIQRYATTWTGDNHSTWDALALSLPMFESLGLSGQPFVGADIGGFIDHGPPPFTSIETFGRINGELLTRWYEVGFLTPFCRNHKVNWGADQEPWRFGPFYEDIIRKYLKLRYRFMPFLYTTFEEAHRSGMPVFRPLVLNYQDDKNTLTLDDQFMIGRDLLVAPILAPHVSTRTVYLPSGTWFDFWTGKSYAGGTRVPAGAPLETVPMYVRGGSVLPMGPEMNHLMERPFDPLIFTVYLDSNGQAEGSYYEDDGLTQDYEKKIYRRSLIHAQSDSDKLMISIRPIEGELKTEKRRLIFRIPSASQAQTVIVDGQPQRLLSSGNSQPGWIKEAEGISIIVADGGLPHTLEVR
jgi:alpha-glucosidase